LTQRNLIASVLSTGVVSSGSDYEVLWCDANLLDGLEGYKKYDFVEEGI
jgi:hypothetical protein